jgi:branched-chain amino acid transport system permease protein
MAAPTADTPTTRRGPAGPAPWLRVALLGALVVVAAALPLLVTDRFTLKVLTITGINAIVVVGLALLFGYAGQISLGHAAFYGLGAYTSAYLVKTLAMPWFVGPIAAVVVCTLLGLVLALPTMRLKGHYLAMATLGFGEIMAVAFVELKQFTGGPDGLSGVPFPSLGTYVLRSPAENFWLVWAVLGIVLLLAYNIVHSRPGRALRALHASEAAASACGVDVSRSKIVVFALSAALAGLAGSLYAHFIGFISPSTFGIMASVLLVAMVVLGGMGSLGGAVVGATLLTLLQFPDAVLPGLPRNIASLVQDWQPDIYGLVLILIMIFAPAGLAGIVRSWRRGRASRTSTPVEEGEGT